MSEGEPKQMSFWDHLEELRGTLFRSVLVVLGVFTVVFCLKGILFDGIILYPLDSSFPLYKLLGTKPDIHLINIEITAQFFIHVKVAFLSALIVSVPMVVYQLWKFIAPGLYENEKAAFRTAFGLGGVLFYAGIAFGYFVLMPIILLFFDDYEVSATVTNTFSLDSYISLISAMTFMMGILFEFPSVVMILSKLRIMTRARMRSWRRYAIVVILILAAVLTPTGDPFTMLVVALPIYLLYEASILICRKDDIDQ